MSLNPVKLLAIVFGWSWLILPNPCLSYSADNFYLGLDALHTGSGTKSDYGREFFAKGQSILRATVGYRLTEDVFFEVATAVTEDKSKQMRMVAGNRYAPGMHPEIPVGGYRDIGSKYKTQFTSVGIGRSFALRPFADTDFSVLVGFSLVKVRANYVEKGSRIIPNPTPNQIIASRRSFDKHSVAPVIRLAITQPVYKDFDLRCSFTWHRLDNIKINAQENSNVSISLKNHSAFGLGFVYHL